MTISQPVTTTTQAVTTTERTSTTTTEAAGLDIQIVRNVRYMTQREGLDPRTAGRVRAEAAGALAGSGDAPWGWGRTGQDVAAELGHQCGPARRRGVRSRLGPHRRSSTLAPEEFRGGSRQRRSAISLPSSVSPVVPACATEGTLSTSRSSAIRREPCRRRWKPSAAPLLPQVALEGAGSTIPESLVLFDGDCLLADPMWDTFVTADPSFMQVESPWPLPGPAGRLPHHRPRIGRHQPKQAAGRPVGQGLLARGAGPVRGHPPGPGEARGLGGDLFINESVAAAARGATQGGRRYGHLRQTHRLQTHLVGQAGLGEPG